MAELKLVDVPGLSWCKQKRRLILVPADFSSVRNQAGMVIAAACFKSDNNGLRAGESLSALVLEATTTKKVVRELAQYGITVGLVEPHYLDINGVYRGYLEVLLEVDVPDDFPEAAKTDLSFESLQPAAHKRCFTDCAVFLASCYDYITDDNCPDRNCSVYELAGHHFYLERMGHASGFSDCWKEHQALTDAAERASYINVEFTGRTRAHVHVN